MIFPHFQCQVSTWIKLFIVIMTERGREVERERVMNSWLSWYICTIIHSHPSIHPFIGFMVRIKANAMRCLHFCIFQVKFMAPIAKCGLLKVFRREIINTSFSLAGFVVLLNVMRAFQTFLNSFHDYFAIWTATIGAVRQLGTLMFVYFLYSLAFAVGLHSLYIAQVGEKG